MKRYLIISLVGSSLLGLFACSNDNNSTPALTGAFRLVNGVSDSSGLSASASSGFASSGTVAFDAAGSVVDVPDGGYNVQLTPGSGNEFTVNNVSIQHNNLSTLFTYGSVIAGTANGFVAEENFGTPPSNDFTLQFVNDTTQATTTALSIYLVPIGTSIGTAQPAAQANAANASQDVSFAAGTYEIIVTDNGVTVYDSGSTGAGIVLPTPDANVIQIGALDATAAQASANGGAPITLLVMDNNGGETLHLSGQN